MSRNIYKYIYIYIYIYRERERERERERFVNHLSFVLIKHLFSYLFRLNKLFFNFLCRIDSCNLFQQSLCHKIFKLIKFLYQLYSF